MSYKNNKFNLTSKVYSLNLKEYILLEDLQEFLRQDNELIRLIPYRKITLFEYFKAKKKLLGDKFQ